MSYTSVSHRSWWRPVVAVAVGGAAVVFAWFWTWQCFTWFEWVGLVASVVTLAAASAGLFRWTRVGVPWAVGCGLSTVVNAGVIVLLFHTPWLPD